MIRLVITNNRVDPLKSEQIRNDVLVSFGRWIGDCSFGVEYSGTMPVSS